MPFWVFGTGLATKENGPDAASPGPAIPEPTESQVTASAKESTEAELVRLRERIADLERKKRSEGESPGDRRADA